MDVNKTEIAKYVVQMQSGDGQAFEKLYNATNQSGYFTALKILKDEDDAQDVLQDSYITVLEKINDVKNPESFVSWFHQIVANKAKNYLAKKKPSLFASDDEEQEATEFIPDEDEVWQPEKNVDEDDVRRQVMEIIDGLTDEKRTCVLLYYYNEMSVADIAASVGASENTVKARLFQARKDIRKEVEKLSKKNVALRSATPTSIVIWALRMAAKTEGAKFIAGPAAAAILEGAAAAGAAAATAAGGTAAATAGGLVAKVAAMTVAQKVIAGVVTAGVVAGAAAGVPAVVNNLADEPQAEQETTTEAVAVYEEMTAAEWFDELVTFPEETVTEPVTEPPVEPEPEPEPSPEPSATIAAQTQETISGKSGARQQDTAASTKAPASTRKEYTMATRASTTRASQTKAESTTARETTAQSTAAASTTAAETTQGSSSGNSGQGIASADAPAPAPETKSSQPTPKPTSSSQDKEPDTHPTENDKVEVIVHYFVANLKSDNLEIEVDRGSPITEEMIKSNVLEAVQGEYTGTIIVSPRSQINVPSAEEDSYEFTVDVFVV